jgi:hypothetical protein
LKEVVKHGYIVKPINGQEFTKAHLFNNYVHHFYNVKKTATSEATRFIAKMHLNQLYGYFGRSQELIMTRCVDRKELLTMLSSRIVNTVVKIDDNGYVVLMTGNLNYKVMQQLNLDTSNFKVLERIVKSNVAIAAAVTAYGQIEMIKYKTLPGYTVFYSDTDSLFLDKPLPEHLIGNELGMMKNELIKDDGVKIDKAYFLGIKKYGYIFTNSEGKTIERSVFAGAERNSISFQDIKLMSEGGTIEKEYKDTFIRSFDKMEICIKDKNIQLIISKDKHIKDKRIKVNIIFE